MSFHDIPNIIDFRNSVTRYPAIGSQYDIIGMFGVAGHTHTEPVPWLSFTFGRWVTVDIVAKADCSCQFWSCWNHDIRWMERTERGSQTWSR